MVEEHVRSLRPGIQNLLLARSQDHLVQAHNLFQKKKKLSQLEKDDEYVLSSTRVKFDLTASNGVEQLTEFQELKDRAASVITAMQNGLREVVLDSIKLEIKTMKTNLNKHFCTSLFHAVHLHLITQKLNDPNITHATVAAMLAQHHPSLLKYTDMAANDFFALYKTTHSVGDLPSVPQSAKQAITSISSTLHFVFNCSWDKYIQQYEENEITLALKKQAKAILTEEKTAAAVMEVDAEMPADRKTLQELIDKQVERKVNSALRSTNNAKKESRGPATGASRKKKSNGTSNKTATTQNQNRGRKSQQNNSGNHCSPSRRRSNSNHSKQNNKTNGKNKGRAATSNKDSPSGNENNTSTNSRSRSKRTNSGSNRGNKRS